MSAIAGIYYFDGSPNVQPYLTLLMDAMSHRGPDGQTQWNKNSIGFGHCLLYSTPESLNETLPLEEISSGLTITADARIDNRQELISKLYLKKHPSDISDSEIILEAYKKWGEDCAAHLLGDFAFAIWNAKNQRLYCARDHLGAKSLAFICNEQFFAFATESEALLKLPGISSQANEELVIYFLLPEFQDFNPKKSWLANIDGLLAGQQLTITPKGKPLVKTYWKLEPVHEVKPYSSEVESQEAFLDIFSKAVECRLRLAGDPGAMMSGGMDSAAIQAMTSKILSSSSHKTFHTYSAIADISGSCIESQCIQSLTKDEKINANFVSVPSFKGMIALKDVLEAAWSKPHPVDNHLLLPAMMCLAASKNNHRTLFHGASGDLTTQSPFNYIADYLRQGQLRHAWHECCLADQNHTYMHLPGKHKILARNVWSAWAPPSLISLKNNIRQLKTGSIVKNSIIAPDLAHKLSIEERIRSPYFRATQNIQPNKYIINTSDITSGLTGFGRVAGRYGIDLRDPWADRRVIDFFLNLPTEYKVNNGWTKYIVRSAFESNLDKKVCWHRGKEHLGWHFANAVMDHSHDRINSLLTSNLGLLEAYINKDVLIDRLKRYKDKKTITHMFFLYDILTLKYWLNQTY